MHKLTTTLAAALLLACGIADDAPAAERAFRLAGSGAGQLAEDMSHFTFVAWGSASHLGDWTNEGVVFAMAPPDADGNIPVAGMAIFTAANGDTLIGLIDGVNNINTGLGHATFTWDGGDGRFTGASGMAGFVVSQTPPDANLTFQFDMVAVGRIDF